MNSPRPGPARYIAYSTLTREPVLSHAGAAALLVQTREMPALGFDNRFVEVLDCGADGPDASTLDLRLDEARALYRTVFRGVGTPGQPGSPALALHDAEPLSPARDVTLDIVRGLSRLIDRAEAAGLNPTVATLRVALAEVRAGRNEDV